MCPRTHCLTLRGSWMLIGSQMSPKRVKTFKRLLFIVFNSWFHITRPTTEQEKLAYFWQCPDLITDTLCRLPTRYHHWAINFSWDDRIPALWHHIEPWGEKTKKTSHCQWCKAVWSLSLWLTGIIDSWDRLQPHHHYRRPWVEASTIVAVCIVWIENKRKHNNSARGIVHTGWLQVYRGGWDPLPVM